MQDNTDTNVDRSRLMLLLGLSSTAAAAGCGGGGPTRRTVKPTAASAPKSSAKIKMVNVDDLGPPLGGEGEGGGSH